MRKTTLLALAPWLLCGAETGKQKIPDPPAIELPEPSDPLAVSKPFARNAGCTDPVLVYKTPDTFMQGDFPMSLNPRISP